MTPELEALARRAVACRHWRWMPGMRWVLLDESESGRLDDWQPEGMARPAGALPDLTDPATVGCLLALVREAHNAPHAWVEVRYGKRARVLSPDNYSEGARMLSEWQIGTDAAALVAALEAAS